MDKQAFFRKIVAGKFTNPTGHIQGGELVASATATAIVRAMPTR